MATDTHSSESALGDHTFDAMDVKFEYTNEAWGRANLPQVRMASLMLQRNDVELTETIDRMAKEGLVPKMLDAFVNTKEHLEALAAMLDMATSRSFVALERLGYTPDFLPSEHTMQ